MYFADTGTTIGPMGAHTACAVCGGYLVRRWRENTRDAVSGAGETGWAMGNKKHVTRESRIRTTDEVFETLLPKSIRDRFRVSGMASQLILQYN